MPVAPDPLGLRHERIVFWKPADLVQSVGSDLPIRGKDISCTGWVSANRTALHPRACTNGGPRQERILRSS